MRTSTKNIDSIRKKSTFFQNEINNDNHNNKEEKKEEDKHSFNGNKLEDNIDNNIQINLVNKTKEKENRFDNINPEKNENDIKCKPNNENINILSQEIKKLNVGNQNEKDFISMNNNMQTNNTLNNYTFGQQNIINNSQINQHRNILENLYANNEINQSYNIKNIYDAKNMNSNKNIRNRKIILNNTNSIADSNNSLNIVQKKKVYQLHIIIF